MLHDIRFALRRLWKSKGFTVTAIVTLALGIGANSAIFTLAHAILFKSLPVASPQELVRLGDSDNCCVIGGYQGRFSIFAYPLYIYLRDHTSGFREMAAFQAGLSKVGVRRGGSQNPEPFTDQFVSGNYFAMFGLRPFAGRLFSPADDVRGAPPVAVMSYRAWQQHYGGDPAVVGASFVIDGAPFTIAGIAPAGFFGDTLRPDPPDFWMPLADEPAARKQNSLLEHTDDHWLYVMGRLQRGASAAGIERQVNLELKQWFLANDPPANERGRQQLDQQHITVAPAGGGVAQMKENYEQDLRLLMAITGLVLLIACANLANLQLARGAASLAQISIRVAIGARRFHLVRQTMIESVLLALMGGAAGLLVASEAAALLMRLAFGSQRLIPIDTVPSAAVLGFTFLLALTTGLIFGVAPAWSASRADPAVALHGAGRSTGHTSLAQKSLVVLQAALSLVLLAGAGLMVETLHNLQNQQFGFRMEGGMIANVNAGFAGYAPERLALIYRQIESRLSRISGIRGVGLALYSPMSGNNWQSGATLEERPATRISPSWDRVSSGFFGAVGFRTLRGRIFDERDVPDSTHVAVINQAFADKFLPNEDPLGKRFGLGGPKNSGDYEIVGVVSNVVFRDPRHPAAPPMFFVPMLQMWKSEWEDEGKARSNLPGNIVLRVSSPPADLAAQVQRAFAAIDPNLTLLNVQSMGEELEELVGQERLIARLAACFGLLALLLAAVGLYGVTAYSVSRRTSEIGVRNALGATPAGIVRLVMAGALAQIVIGLAIGVPVSLAAGRLIAGQVYGVKTSDPMVLGAAGAILLLCATTAAALAARRAIRIDPVKALRAEA